jgi:diacylglycerol kinase
MLPILKRHHDSLSYALQGLIYIFRSQPNFKLHALASALVVMLGIMLSLTVLEWLVVVLAIGAVVVAEVFNTAIEATVDLITEERKIKAKIAKDVAAAGVLLTVIFAVILGMIIFIPHIVAFF